MSDMSWEVLQCHVLQGMAGNIIHAIATTNAIIAGFIVVEAIKLLTGAQQACKVTLLGGVPPPSPSPTHTLAN